MKQIAFAVLMSFPPAAVGAQNLTFDLSDTRYCLDTSGTYDEMESCIGASANACMTATFDGSTTVGMGFCISEELAFWDGELNAVYQELRTRERGRDSGLDGTVSLADALRDMQRTWIAYRDATCDYERAQWGGGTGGGPATVGCLMRMTGEQAIFLRQMLEGF